MQHLEVSGAVRIYIYIYIIRRLKVNTYCYYATHILSGKHRVSFTAAIPSRVAVE